MLEKGWTSIASESEKVIYEKSGMKSCFLIVNYYCKSWHCYNT